MLSSFQSCCGVKKKESSCRFLDLAHIGSGVCIVPGICVDK